MDTSNEHGFWFYFERGNHFGLQNEFEKAIENYSISIELDPQYSGARFLRGVAYSHLKEYEKAIEDYSKAIELKPEHEAYNSRGIAYQNLKEYEKAVEDYSKAIELNPQEVEAYHNRGSAYDDLKEYEKAVEDYSKAIELNPQIPESHYNRGGTYIYLSEYEKAIEDCSKAIELNPQYSTAYNNRGVAYSHLKEYEKAIEDYSKTIEINPQYSDAYNNRGITYNDLKEYEKAVEDYSKAIEIDPQNSKVYYNRYRTLKILGERERALVDRMTSIKLGYVRVPQETTTVDFNDFDRDLTILQKRLRNTKFQDLKIHKNLGSGSYGRTYLCSVKDVEGEFVVKIYRSHLSIKKRKEQRERDSLYLRNHPNLAVTLSHSDSETIDLETLPDFEEFWKPLLGEEETRVKKNSSMILMNYYPGDLGNYLEKKKKGEISLKKTCRLIQGILKGADFLHSKMIVHRDLHPGNILIDEEKDRVWICDFGCSLDLRQNHLKFVVSKKDDVMYSLFSDATDGSFGRSWRVGGQVAGYLPPEIRNSLENDDVESLDYEKCDIYSVGVIGKNLLEKTGTSQGDELFDRISSFIDRFLHDDPKKRINFRDAIRGIRELTTSFVSLDGSGKKEKEEKEEEESTYSTRIVVVVLFVCVCVSPFTEEVALGWVSVFLFFFNYFCCR